MRDVCLEPLSLTDRQLATKLDVAASTVARVLAGKSDVTSEMALRLSKALGRSAES